MPKLSDLEKFLKDPAHQEERDFLRGVFDAFKAEGVTTHAWGRDRIAPSRGIGGLSRPWLASSISPLKFPVKVCVMYCEL